MRTLGASMLLRRPLTLAQCLVSGAALAVATRPVNAAGPALAITNFARSGPGSVVLRWTAETNAFTNLFFKVEGTTTFASNFATLSGPIPETASYCRSCESRSGPGEIEKEVVSARVRV